MLRKLAFAATAASLAVLVGGAVPALSSESGAVAVSVSAEAPAAPCLTVTPASVDFGTRPFSGASPSLGRADLTFRNCGTAIENVLGSATDASSPAGTWTLVQRFGGTVSPCPTLDTFNLNITVTGAGGLPFGYTPAPLRDANAQIGAFSPGVSYPGQLDLTMPCQGSNGPGETKTLTATFTAVVA
jgi:hypothetical protein